MLSGRKAGPMGEILFAIVTLTKRDSRPNCYSWDVPLVGPDHAALLATWFEDARYAPAFYSALVAWGSDTDAVRWVHVVSTPVNLSGEPRTGLRLDDPDLAELIRDEITLWRNDRDFTTQSQPALGPDPFDGDVAGGG